MACVLYTLLTLKKNFERNILNMTHLMTLKTFLYNHVYSIAGAR